MRKTSSDSSILGRSTSAIGLWAMTLDRTASFITRFMIWAAFTTVAAARRVARSFTHAWQSTQSMLAIGRVPKTGRMWVRTAVVQAW